MVVDQIIVYDWCVVIWVDVFIVVGQVIVECEQVCIVGQECGVVYVQVQLCLLYVVVVGVFVVWVGVEGWVVILFGVVVEVLWCDVGQVVVYQVVCVGVLEVGFQIDQVVVWIEMVLQVVCVQVDVVWFLLWYVVVVYVDDL